jgi:arylsulfatase A-like enzyme
MATLRRRDFLGMGMGAGASLLALPAQAQPAAPPNLLFVFADQWRGQATGYAGDPNAITPNLDRMARTGLNLTNTVAVCPVCSPYRGSLMTGQYPLTHGVFINDVPLASEANCVGDIYKQAGYATGYIGKWHLNGSPKGRHERRGAFIPRDRRQGFDLWQVLECTHNYNRSPYFGDTPDKLVWEGYDAIAQTREAQSYIKKHAKESHPFCLFLSWGPPHNPYETAPPKYRKLYADREIKLRPNVPERSAKSATRDLRGYYAHIAALDDCMGQLLQTLREAGVHENTIVVFTSDHGDMLGSHGLTRKLLPWDESALVPFLLQYPQALGGTGRSVDLPISTPDILPTLLGFSGIPVPASIEGTDFSATLKGTPGAPGSDGALFELPVPYHTAITYGVAAYRGLRTRRHTYVETRDGPWLLYDNRSDPCQLKNLVGTPGTETLQAGLAKILHRKLAEREDTFLPPQHYVDQWKYNHMRELRGKYPAPGQPQPPKLGVDATGWFAVVKGCSVKKHKLGCAVEAPDGSGSALRKLPKPITGKATITARYRSISEDNPRNAFLVLASGPIDRRQTWVGSFAGVGKLATFQGPCQGTQGIKSAPSRTKPTDEFTVEIEVDVKARTARMKANGETLTVALPRDFDALRFVGCGVFCTVAAFTKIKIVEH